MSEYNEQSNETFLFNKNQLSYLDERLNERLSEQKKDLIGGRWQYFWMRLVSHLLVTSIPIVILVLLLTPVGDVLGIRLGWFGVPPVPPGAIVTGAAVIQPKAVLESMRDLLTVIVPMFLGVAIWLVTIVAERRLKEYDTTLDKFRDSSSKVYDAFRQEIRDAEDRIGKRVEELVLSKVVENTQKSINDIIRDTIASFRIKTEDSSNKLDEMRKSIEERFGALADNTSYLKDIGPLTSVGFIKGRVEYLLSNNKTSEAINLTMQLLSDFIKGRDNHAGHRPSGTLGDWFNLSAILG